MRFQALSKLVWRIRRRRDPKTSLSIEARASSWPVAKKGALDGIVRPHGWAPDAVVAALPPSPGGAGVTTRAVASAPACWLLIASRRLICPPRIAEFFENERDGGRSDCTVPADGRMIDPQSVAGLPALATPCGISMKFEAANAPDGTNARLAIARVGNQVAGRGFLIPAVWAEVSQP